ncbi:hypothetical protein [Chryseobacterium arthrosphaerae]|uniref:hypothetical protein n=1 Tax=Chryseobacterium arthrosphaerae TaxID=651561 RepID=UPI00241D93D4|nr:hypothetical protein [Chryseobacterium arthrosphaerae]
MKATYEIINETLGYQTTLIGRSFYHNQNGKVVRFADHLPNVVNFNIYNEDAKEVLMVFVNCNASELEMQNSCDEVAYALNINEVDYLIYNDDDNDLNNIETLKMLIERFLND